MVNLAAGTSGIAGADEASPSSKGAGAQEVLDRVRSALASCSGAGADGIRAWAQQGSLVGAGDSAQQLLRWLQEPGAADASAALACLAALAGSEAAGAVLAAPGLCAGLLQALQPAGEQEHAAAAGALLARAYAARPQLFEPRHAGALAAALASGDLAAAQQAAVAAAAASSTDAGAAALAAAAALPGALLGLLASKQGLCIKYALITAGNLAGQPAFQSAATQQGLVQAAARVVQLRHPLLSDYAAEALAQLLRGSPAAQDAAAGAALHAALLRHLAAQQLQRPGPVLDCLANLVLQHPGNQAALLAARGHLPLLQLLGHEEPGVRCC
jgi:hypothetical protein